MIDWFYFWTFKRISFAIKDIAFPSEVLKDFGYNDIPRNIRYWMWLNGKAMCLVEIKKWSKRSGSGKWELIGQHIKFFFTGKW